MGFFDILLSILPNVPFLPPAAPTNDKKNQQTGPSSRFLGKSPQKSDIDGKPMADKVETEK